jgi:hypothetical protein
VRPAVIVGHPGHELRILGWLADKRPIVHVLTDGSGATGRARLSATSKLLNRIGAPAGAVFGILSDTEIYRAILEQNVALVGSIVDQLATSLVNHGIDSVAADAAEGFNPTHDICRQIANAAIYRAQKITGRSIASYEFLLTEWDLKLPATHDHRCWHTRLGDGPLRLKLDAARDYDGLRKEVEQAIALKGEEYFRIECFKRVTNPFLELQRGYKPDYEQTGERRVATGKYCAAIRYETHMAPLLSGIRDYAIQRSEEMNEVGRTAMKAVS